MKSDNGVNSTIKDSLKQNSALIKTAVAAVDQIIKTIDDIKTQLAQAKDVKNGDYSDINTTLQGLGATLKEAVANASFNGQNLLNGTLGTELKVVSGFGSGKFSTIDVQLAPLFVTGSTAVTTTSTGPTVDTASEIAKVKALTAVAGPAAYGKDAVVLATNKATVTNVALDGTQTVTEYTGVDANGVATATIAAAVKFTTTVTTTVNAGTGELVKGSSDLTQLSIATNGTNIDQAALDIDAALQGVRDLGSALGAALNRIEAQSEFVSALSESLTNGISAMVDADMNEASTRLQALQTQQQLGVQSLSIANQNSQMILKLFQ
jgi:flagellin